MKLWLVTWDLDLVQFLVDAETESEAIYKAIRANKKIESTEYDSDMEATNTYSADLVDMELLCEIVKRNDVCAIIDNVICYTGW
jgi:hypothetical protein